MLAPFPFVKQQDKKDCSIACLFVVLKITKQISPCTN